MRFRVPAVFLGILFLAAPLMAATRLTFDIGGGRIVAVSWPASAFPLHFVIDSRLANSLPTAKQQIEGAEAAWAAVPEATVSFAPLVVESGVQARGDDHRNTITFADGLFANQKCLAFTTPLHDDAGHLVDTDIQVDASLPASRYNLQQLLTHELGHALGLDHSAVVSATMYPWISPNAATELDSDDRIAIASIYPRGDVGATLQGHVSGADGAIFAAQVVAVNAQGEPVATGLTDANGDFLLKGMPSGDYRVYAEPLDGPVVIGNLSGVWRTAKDKAFPTAFADGGQALHVESGKIYGNVTFTLQGNVTLNPLTIGISPVGSSDLRMMSSPVAIKPGTSTQIAVGGEGFANGGTTFEVLNPGFHRTSDFNYGPNYAEATFAIDRDASPGSAVILVHNGNDIAALTGALRVNGARRVRAVGR